MPVAADAAGGAVDLERAKGDERVGVARIAPGDRADAGREFREIEGLDEIVVRARIQSLDPVRDLVERGEDDDGRHVAPAAQRLEERDAAAVRQHEVEQDEVEGAPAMASRRRIQPHDPVDGMAVACDLVAHGGAQHGVVFDQQDAHVGSRSSASPCSARLTAG